MDPLLAINGSSPLFNIGSTSAVSSSSSLLASELSLSTPILFGGTTQVELSGLGQVLSTAATFQDQLQALQPGTATSGGGQNYGTDFASFAAEAQSLVDAFNGLQNNITNISFSGNLLAGGVSDASGLIQSLDTQAQADYTNGNSALTNLAQLGIEYLPSPLTGGGSLRIDLAALQTAFNSDAPGVFSLLSKAANALGEVAGNFIQQNSGRYSSLAALQQITGSSGLFGNLMTDNSSGNFNIASLLSSGSLTGNANVQQMLVAMNEYALVSRLFA